MRLNATLRQAVIGETLWAALHCTAGTRASRLVPRELRQERAQGTPARPMCTLVLEMPTLKSYMHTLSSQMHTLSSQMHTLN